MKKFVHGTERLLTVAGDRAEPAAAGEEPAHPRSLP